MLCTLSCWPDAMCESPSCRLQPATTVNINGMVEQKWHTDHANSRRIENIFEMFVLRTTGQSRILRAKLLPSLEGRKNKKKS
jgi:hypothetical protein